ncbi:MAG TPA: phosphatidate cytidylyltransferase [Thermoanaerobaculia bacterium]
MSDPSPAPIRSRFARELTTIVAAPVVVAIIGWAPVWAYVALITVALSLALWEFIALGARKGYPVQQVISILLMLLLVWTFLDREISVEIGVFAILLAIPASYVFAKSPLEEALPATAVCVLATLYVGMLGGALIRLRTDFEGVGPQLVFFLLITVWAADAGAYYVGRKFGKHRLSPRVSPKKSVEGLVGGVATSLLAAAVVHFTFFPELPLLHAIGAAFILSIMGVIGDLAESMWKRSAAVKDSGALIPGHGGFLDRVDSILFTAPILYAYWYLLNNPWSP